MKKHTFIIFALFIILSQIPAESPFVVIMYDSLSEKNIGSFPPNRKIWADTINPRRDIFPYAFQDASVYASG